MSFENIGLKKEIINVLNSLKFKTPMEVQKKIIPLAAQGKNLVFTAQTGSGKTLAYTVGFLSKINKKYEVQMIVLVPTRELAIQVGKEIGSLAEPLGLSVGVLYGGREIKGDYKTLNKKNQILVGTPGRLIQHVNDKKIKVGEVKLLVFDESDQMFDQGFAKDCSYLKTRVSKTAQIILSSATMTDKVHFFVSTEIKDPETLIIGIKIPKNIVQEKKFCEKEEKNDILIKLFNEKKFKKAIVFCNTKIKTQGIAEFLKHKNLNVQSLSSDLQQEDRIKYLNLFKEGKINILVTTDIAARGLHIEKVDIVINYDVPTRDEFYVHRIGRTGRVEKKGYALTLICPEDVDRFDNIEFDYELDIKEI
jgi:ATP-dependent RNA helicase DeaD